MKLVCDYFEFSIVCVYLGVWAYPYENVGKLKNVKKVIISCHVFIQISYRIFFDSFSSFLEFSHLVSVCSPPARNNLRYKNVNKWLAIYIKCTDVHTHSTYMKGEEKDKICDR